MPIPPAAHYISCPLQPHLLYHFVAAAQQFVVRRVSEQQGEELQGGRVADGRGDGEAGAGQGIRSSILTSTFTLLRHYQLS